MRMGRRGSAWLVSACFGASILALPCQAPAAETIGLAAPASGCTGSEAYTQGPLMAAVYSPTNSGVISSWSSFAGTTANTQLELLVLKPNGGTHFIATQRDTPRVLTQANALNTFTGMHIPISAGERLGLYLPAGGADCFILMPPDTGLVYTGGEPALNVDTNFA